MISTTLLILSINKTQKEENYQVTHISINKGVNFSGNQKEILRARGKKIENVYFAWPFFVVVVVVLENGELIEHRSFIELWATSFWIEFCNNHAS